MLDGAIASRMARHERPRRLRLPARSRSANTRRYHGLLVASLRPPVDRIADGRQARRRRRRYRGRRFELTTNEFADGTLAPRGFEHLMRSASTARSRCGRLAHRRCARRAAHLDGARVEHDLRAASRCARATRARATSSSRRCAPTATITRTSQGGWSLDVTPHRQRRAVSPPSLARSPYRLLIDRGDSARRAGLVLELPASRRKPSAASTRGRPVPPWRLPRDARAGRNAHVALPLPSDAEPIPRRRMRSNRSAHASGVAASCARRRYRAGCGQLDAGRRPVHRRNARTTAIRSATR